MLETSLRFEGPLDLRATLAPLAMGFGDPTARLAPDEIVRATRTPEGPATLHAVVAAEGELRARAWGDGAAWALARVRDLFGLDEPAADVASAAPAVRALARGARGLRLARTHRVVEALVPLVLGQLVSGRESSRAFRRLVLHFSEPAPGPFDDLWLPLGAEQLRRIPAAAYPAAGALERQGATLREIAWRAHRLEEIAALPDAEAERRLRAVPGIGPWTAGWTLLGALGHADAVPLGDFHLPRLVAFHLAGEERADDARMLALLEPYRGQRGRVLRWIEAAGRLPPRRGPRLALRELPAEARWLLRRR